VWTIAFSGLRSREKMKARLEAGEHDDKLVELKVAQTQVQGMVLSGFGTELMEAEIQTMPDRFIPMQAQARDIPVKASPGIRRPRPGRSDGCSGYRGERPR